MNNGPKNDSRTRRRSLLFKLPYNQPQEQTSISDIVFLCPPQDTQVDDDEYKVFFELKHWKVQSEKFSTKCFSFMDFRMEMLTTNKGYELPLYYKPTDFTRKKLNVMRGNLKMEWLPYHSQLR
uniref:C2 Aida-type domain-containing protein n=4 Tax=Lotharella globosa TaxID=91324 RepID=A0A6V3NTZ0_9EUKA|mmetsp:Transcript_8853/g.16797  ORF Transcript_8853/g.16797 Transcript_8853/m.16797 type:complete len:123 (+) Transcript_8853:2219-2587(+)